MKKIFGASVIIVLSFCNVFCQTIIEEGKGIDALTLGIKESKVTKTLGENFHRKAYGDGEYRLEYPEELMSFSFDVDSVVYEIVIKPQEYFKTKKGLKISEDLRISDLEKIYGEDWWTTKERDEIGYDIGIRFELKNDIVHQIIIEESDLEKGNDYSFFEYLDGVYIPENLEECFIELNALLEQKKREELRILSEDDFTTDAHFGLGLWIRNNWGLWKGSRLFHFFINQGIVHPDDMSGIILTSYNRNLNGVEIELEKQIKDYQAYWKKLKNE